jgi:dihydroorotate dehydrogenase (NAD+) catalytic subunit
MGKLIIGAPFGIYLGWPGAVSTIGTYTLLKRAGFLKRLWRVLYTVRYQWRTQSWLNRLGLPNPGIDSLCFEDCVDRIVSIHGLEADDWQRLVEKLRYLCDSYVEFNVSCPNVSHKTAPSADLVCAVELALRFGMTPIAKLPPIRWMDLAVPLYGAGVRHFHCCNSMPTTAGGMSGKPLKPYSLWAVHDLKEQWGDDVIVTGGGGVTCLQDVMDYVAAGATNVAVASMLLNPFNWQKIPAFLDYMDNRNAIPTPTR